MVTIGRLNVGFYKELTGLEIISDEVVLTDDRASHIMSRRGVEFYNFCLPELAGIISDPDYVFLDKHPNSVLVAKRICEIGINVVVRLAVEGDNPSYKNSVITVIKENNKRFEQTLRNKSLIYEKCTQIVQ